MTGAPLLPTAQKINAVVFDLGNVLIPWNPSRLYRKIFPSPEKVDWFLREVCNDAWNLEIDRGWPFSEAIAEAISRHPDEREAIIAWQRRWAEMLGEADPDAVNLLRELKLAGMPLFVLSNWSSETFPLAEARYPFLAWFDGLVISGREKVVKPEPEIYRRLIQRCACPASEILFIDDRDRNVAAARGMGITALLYLGPDRLRSDLLELGLPVGPHPAEERL
ncbi:HAD family phosphatase [Limibacillus sp. MBR-115]|uniref:HAD family hydrolase n=1 Tax=Limibacillus sp. MBR-115 TaxID=3156465 RepID=UPI003392A26D